VNGLTVHTNPSGTSVYTDQNGILTLIAPNKGIISNTFSVATVGSAKASTAVLPIDPSDKVYEALSKIKTAADLQNAKTQTGRPLLENTQLSSSEIDQTAKAIATAVSARDQGLAKNGFSRKSSAPAPTDNARYGQNLDRLNATVKERGVVDWFEVRI
jgi:hypothetical protein